MSESREQLNTLQKTAQFIRDLPSIALNNKRRTALLASVGIGVFVLGSAIMDKLSKPTVRADASVTEADTPPVGISDREAEEKVSKNFGDADINGITASNIDDPSQFAALITGEAYSKVIPEGDPNTIQYMANLQVTGNDVEILGAVPQGSVSQFCVDKEAKTITVSDFVRTPDGNFNDYKTYSVADGKLTKIDEGIKRELLACPSGIDPRPEEVKAPVKPKLQ